MVASRWSSLAFGWRSGLPLRFRRSVPTALAAAGLHPAPIQALPSYTDTLQRSRPNTFALDSDECTGEMGNIPPSSGLAGHRNFSPRSRLESRALSLLGKKSRL